MGKKGTSGTSAAKQPAATAKGRPSALLDTRVVYCGDNLEQLAKLPDAWLRRAKSSRVDLIYIDPPFNSNRNYEVFWGETKEKRAFEDRHAWKQAFIRRSRTIPLNHFLCVTFTQEADFALRIR
jgi:hypothetical protein